MAPPLVDDIENYGATLYKFKRGYWNFLLLILIFGLMVSGWSFYAGWIYYNFWIGLLLFAILLVITFILVWIVNKARIQHDIQQKEIDLHSNRICPNCGRKIPFDAVLCPYCGKKFEDFLS